MSTTEYVKSKDFLNIRLSDVLHIVSIVVLGIGFLLSNTNRSAATTANVNQLAESVKALTASLKDIDSQGTRGSQLAVKIVAEHEAEDQRRIANLEQQFSQFFPRMAEMQTKIDVIAALLEKKKQQ